MAQPDLNRCFAALPYGLPPEVVRLAGAGALEAARRRCLALVQAGGLPGGAADALTAAAEIFARLPAHYPYPRAEALSLLRQEIPDFTMAELDARCEAGEFDWRTIEGERRLQGDFLDSLRMYPAWNARGLAPAAGEADLRDRVIAAMQKQGSLSAAITLKASIAPAASLGLAADTPCRAWLPIPAACPQQSEIEILDAAPGARFAPDTAPQRTAYWEGCAGDGPFWVRYRYRITASLAEGNALTPDAVQPQFCTEEEAPHILFTPYLRALCAEVTAGCTDALQKARAIYDYVTLNTNYRYQPAYAVQPAIAETCARSHWGDCGVMALLFITLCRIAGIPAKWQSGLYVTPGHASSHDWAMFYLAPHGWLWADCSFGAGAHRIGNEARRQHYFGNLDPLRMVANRAFYAPLTPPCTAWRNDSYDNQSGELAVNGRCLYDAARTHQVTVEDFTFDATV